MDKEVHFPMPPRGLHLHPTRPHIHRHLHPPPFTQPNGNDNDTVNNVALSSHNSFITIRNEVAAR